MCSICKRYVNQTWKNPYKFSYVRIVLLVAELVSNNTNEIENTVIPNTVFHIKKT